MILTGRTAALFYEGRRIGKCRSFDLTIDRAAVSTTKRGDWDESFVAGLRSTKATASLLYDPEDRATVALLEAVYDDSENTKSFDLYFDLFWGKRVCVDAIITSLGVSVAFDQVQACPVALQVSGKPRSTF